jgi:cobyrinic acid a,c-diamide synthase
MKAAVVQTPGIISIDEVEEPSPGPGEAVMEVGACGICGTDYHQFHVSDGPQRHHLCSAEPMRTPCHWWVEGVMGLFDGRDANSEEGSTAQMAKWPGLPVVLVVDAFALSRSAGAVVKGFSEFDPELRIAGVVFNRVGSPTHLQWLIDAVHSAAAVDVLGGIPNDPEVTFPERHLGLVMPDEKRTASWIERMADLIEDSVYLDQSWQRATCHCRG